MLVRSALLVREEAALGPYCVSVHLVLHVVALRLLFEDGSIDWAAAGLQIFHVLFVEVEHFGGILVTEDLVNPVVVWLRGDAFQDLLHRPQLLDIAFVIFAVVKHGVEYAQLISIVDTGLRGVRLPVFDGQGFLQTLPVNSNDFPEFFFLCRREQILFALLGRVFFLGFFVFITSIRDLEDLHVFLRHSIVLFSIF